MSLGRDHLHGRICPHRRNGGCQRPAERQLRPVVGILRAAHGVGEVDRGGIDVTAHDVHHCQPSERGRPVPG